MAENKAEKYLMRRYQLTGTMNQSMNPFLMSDSDFLYLKNITHDEIGTISKDGGYSEIGDSRVGDGKVDLLFDYIPYTGSHIPLTIENGRLQKYVSGWGNVTSAAEFTPDARASAVNFNNKAYIATANDELSYTEGGAVTSVSTDNGGASVRGRYLAECADMLCLGNLTEVHSPNEVVFSIEGTHVFYDPGLESYDTYATTDRIISVDGAITGLASFQGLLMIFTHGATYFWNPENNNTKKLCSFGTDSHWSIKELNGMLYFANRDGVFRFNGENLPELISIPITNWAINSVWRLVDGGNWATMSAEAFEGKYYLSIGDLTGLMPGDTELQEGVVLVYDAYRNNWSFLTGHPCSMLCKVVNEEGNQRLWFGSNEGRVVYQKDYSYAHDGVAFDMVVRTKYYDFGMPENVKGLFQLYATYRSGGNLGDYLTVSVATDGSNAYEEKVGETTASKLELSGAAGRAYEMKRVDMTGLQGRTVSYEFSNSDEGVSFEIVGFTQEFNYRNVNLNVAT
jgi:hypothetical protein